MKAERAKSLRKPYNVVFCCCATHSSQQSLCTCSTYDKTAPFIALLLQGSLQHMAAISSVCCDSSMRSVFETMQRDCLNALIDCGVRSDWTCFDTVSSVGVLYLVHVFCSVCEFCWSAVYAPMWWVPQECSIFSDVVSSVGVLRVLRCEFHWRVVFAVGVRRFGYRLLVTRWKQTSLRSSSFA